MLETRAYGAVTQIRMSAELDGKAVYWVAAYLVDGLLIDTGCHHTAHELCDFLKKRDLKQVVNTHYHEDHTGANHEIIERYAVEVLAHPEAVPLIGQRFEICPYQEIAWGYPVPTKVKPIAQRINTARYAFRVVETPGHCAGHICLYEASQGWCFTGDLFAREKPKFIRPEENIGLIIASMRKVLEQADDRLVLFTAVGKIVEDGKKALMECIDYLSGLAAQVKGLAQRGASIESIVKDVFGGEHAFAGLTNGQFSTYNLVRSLLETMP